MKDLALSRHSGPCLGRFRRQRGGMCYRGLVDGMLGGCEMAGCRVVGSVCGKGESLDSMDGSECVWRVLVLGWVWTRMVPALMYAGLIYPVAA